MNLTQRQLRLFVTTADLGNISRASEALHISQPALTRALQDFETQLGQALFHRTTRRLGLTPGGERFLPAARRLLADMEQATRELRDQATGLLGTVTLAVGTAFGCALLPGVLRRFSPAHPGVRVRLIDDNSAGITSRVARAEADLGIGSPVGDTSELVCTRLLEAPIGLLADPASYPLRATASAADLTALPLLKEPADTSIAQLLRAHGSELVAQMERGTEVSSLALQLALARAGVGVAVLSALGASHPAAQGLRFVPLRPRVSREIFLIRHRSRPLPPAAAALAATLTDTLRERPEGLHPAVRLLP